MLTFYHRGQDAVNRWKNIIPHFFTMEIGDMFQKHAHKTYLPNVTGKMKGDMPVTRGKNSAETLRFQKASVANDTLTHDVPSSYDFIWIKATKTQKFMGENNSTGNI